MNEYKLSEYCLQLKLQDYPEDLVKDLLSTSDLKETLIILDKIQHEEHKEHSIFMYLGALSFRSLVHYEKFTENVENDFITVSNLNEFLDYMLLDDNLSLYRTFEVMQIKALKEQVKTVLENGQGYRLVEVEFDEC